MSGAVIGGQCFFKAHGRIRLAEPGRGRHLDTVMDLDSRIEWRVGNGLVPYDEALSFARQNDVEVSGVM